MNRKISVGMTVTIVILAMTVTFSITMLLAMRLFDRMGGTAYGILPDSSAFLYF